MTSRPDQGAEGPAEEVSAGIPVVFVVLALVYCRTNPAVHAERWHDRGKSGWWSLIGFVPYVGGIWMLVECGFLKGTVGPDANGHDPNALNVAEVFEWPIGGDLASAGPFELPYRAGGAAIGRRNRCLGDVWC